MTATGWELILRFWKSIVRILKNEILIPQNRLPVTRIGIGRIDLEQGDVLAQVDVLLGELEEPRPTLIEAEEGTATHTPAPNLQTFIITVR